MTGVVSRSGFRFQDLVLVHRVLTELIDVRLAEIGAKAAVPPLTYCIETNATSAGGGPDWDLITLTTGGSAVLEEVKSGPPSAEDRRQFWLRLRRTLSRVEQGEAVIPRLTVNKDNPPANPEIWRGLRAAVGSAVPERVPRVTSAAELAREALFFLTGAVDDEESAPVSLPRASQAMGGFEYTDSLGFAELEERVLAAVRVLSKDLAVNEIGNAVLGFVGKIAAEKNCSAHAFVAADVWSTIAALRVLSTVSAADAALWRSFRAEAIPQWREEGGHVGSGLPYQEWQNVQPALAAVMAAVPGRVAIIGHGGTGKSVALAEVCRELGCADVLVVWLPGADLRGVSAAEFRGACELGRFVCAAFGRALVLAVDAAENAGTVTEVGLLLASIGRVADGIACRAIVTIRALTWREVAGSQEMRAGWAAATLREWDSELVRTLCEASQRPTVGEDLVRLLRTPLLLDIFLRTFGRAEAVPAGLQSRHALLSAYWSRRVLPDGDPRTPARNTWLAAAAQWEADGRSRHTSDSEPARDLASEGVLEVVGGSFRFRHALLRDFALMQRCVEGARSASEFVGRIAAVRSSLVRWGALRAGIEASCEGTLDLRELITSSFTDSALSFSFAESLGDLDDPTILPVETLNAALAATADGGALLHRCLALAVLGANGGWVRLLARFPDARHWAEAAAWITGDVLDQAVSLLHAADRAGSADPTAVCDVAIRIREWAQAPRLSSALLDFDGFGLQRVIFCVAAFAPGASTVRWMTDVAPATWRTRFAALHSLPTLAKAAERKGIRLDGTQLQALYLAASGFVWRDGGLEDSREIPSPLKDEYDRIQVPLLGRDVSDYKGVGLLAARPDAFTVIAIGILVGNCRARDRERAERWAALSVDATPPGRPIFERTDIQQVVERLEATAGAKLSREETVGELEDDLFGTEYDHPNEGAEEALASGVRLQFASSVRDGSQYIQRVYYPALATSPTTVGRLIAIDCLVEHGRGEELHQFLLDKRLLHNSDTHYWMWSAVKLCWNTLPQEHRARLLENIRTTTRSPALTAFGVARVLSAVPADARPQDLQPYFELYAMLGADPEPRKPGRSRHSAHWTPIPDLPRETLDGLDSAADVAWHQLRSVAKEFVHHAADDEGVREALGLLVTALRNGVPSLEALKKQRWPISVAHTVLSRAVRSAELQRTSTVTRDDAILIFAWGLSVAQAIPAERVNNDPSPLDVGDSSSDYDEWTEALDLVDDALWLPSIRDDVQLLKVVFDEVARIVSGVTPKTARKAFHTISWPWWISSPGLPMLRALLSITDAGALHWALSIVGHLEETEQLHWMRTWLTEPSGVELSKGAERFAGELGHYLGVNALYRPEGEKNALRVFTESLLNSKPAVGLVSEPSRYVSWCSHLVFGAKEDIKTRLEADVADFAALARSAWRAADPVALNVRTEDRWSGRFGLFTIHWLVDELKGRGGEPRRDVQRAWTALSPLVCEMIADGDRADVFDIVFALRESSTVDRLGAESLLGVASAVSGRAAREGPERLRERTRPGHTWLEVLEYASELLEAIASASRVEEADADRIHNVLQEWGRLGAARAIKAARNLRSARGRG